MKYDLVILGNIAFDINRFPLEKPEKKVINLGGAGFYSLLPASIFSKNIGIVARVGNDFPKKVLEDLEIDLKGLKIIEEQRTIRFYHTYISEDGQKRTFRKRIIKDVLIQPQDIPSDYFSSNYIHISTNFPQTQIEFIKYLREYSSSILSIDTHEAYLKTSFEKVLEAFNMSDIAFIDHAEERLISECRAPIKIIKKGKEGVIYISNSYQKDFPTTPCKVIDKTGAGDVLAGVFLTLRGKGYSVDEAMEKAVKVASLSIQNYGVEFLVGVV